jgi:hypothetical protein
MMMSSVHKCFFGRRPQTQAETDFIFQNPINGQTKHKKLSYTQQHCYDLPKNLMPWRDSNPGLLFLRRMRCPRCQSNYFIFGFCCVTHVPHKNILLTRGKKHSLKWFLAIIFKGKSS